MTPAIGAAHALSGYLLPPLYAWLGAAEPQPVLRIESAGGHTLCDRVALRRLDAAFVFFDHAHADLSVTPFARSSMVLVHSTQSAQSLPAGEVDVARLDPTREIHMSWGPDFDRWRERTLPAEPLVTLDSVHSLEPSCASRTPGQ